MKVEHWDAERDGKLSEAALREKLASLGYESARYAYSPGAYLSWHTHSVDKMDAVLSGRLRITMAGAGHCARIVHSRPLLKPPTVNWFPPRHCRQRRDHSGRPRSENGTFETPGLLRYPGFATGRRGSATNGFIVVVSLRSALWLGSHLSFRANLGPYFAVHVKGEPSRHTLAF
jgi:hypothetical protein